MKQISMGRRKNSAETLRRMSRALTTVRGMRFELGHDVEEALEILRLIGGVGGGACGRNGICGAAQTS